MIKINIICIGKIKEKYFTDAIAEYAKRLTAFCKFNIIELSEERIKSNIPNRSQIDEVIFSEGKRIMQKISPSDYVVAMCIEGKPMSSEELSTLIDNASVSGKSTTQYSYNPPRILLYLQTQKRLLALGPVYPPGSFLKM